MRNSVIILLLALAAATAQQVNPPRDGVDLIIGGGAWLPGLFNDGNQLSVGTSFLVGIETPMFQADQFRLTAGPAFCSSDNGNYDGITAVMLNAGYRKYPFFRPYAGSRGIEPFLGVTAGGLVVWDRTSDTFEDGESTSTGGAMLGAELGTRVKVGENVFLDLTLGADWVPIGAELAGEMEKDLSGLRIQGSLIF